MNPYIAVACIAVFSVVSFLVGGIVARLGAQNELNQLKWAAVSVIAENRVNAFAEGEQAAQARIALAEALKEEGQQ
jgi:hypothetical protein